MCAGVIERIDILADRILDVAGKLQTSDHDPRVEPLISRLEEESRNLKEIYNEFCWLEMREQ